MDNISLSLYNTQSRKKESLVPIKDNTVTFYTCGPTVYHYAHIGNFRTYVFEDILRRTIHYLGMEVEQAMNFTDVDDKTIRGALKAGKSLDDYTRTFKEAFIADIATLKIQDVEHRPEATGYIDRMIQVIQKLLDTDYAYIGGDGSIYFSLARFPSYGKLSHLPMDSLKTGASQRVHADEYDKDNVSDFALWKHHDPERDGDIYWDSPFGPGRPGWHLECSTMAIDLLGDTIDIHAGGVDNIFPHHENEIAQSEAYTGKPFVKIWVHSEYLIVDNNKMSKSLGNFFTLRDLIQKGYTGEEVRYMLFQTHYRMPLNFTLPGLDAARASLARIHNFVERIQNITTTSSSGAALPIIKHAEETFITAMADDLNTSAALAALFNMIRELNTLIDTDDFSVDDAKNTLETLQQLDTILAIIIPQQTATTIPDEISSIAQQRQNARQSKDWALADQLREQLHSQGWDVTDTPHGPKIIPL